MSLLYAQVTSHSRAPYGLLPDCFEQNCTSTHRARADPVQCRTKFACSFNTCIISERARAGLQIVNSLWTAHAGTVRGPARPNTTPVRERWWCRLPYEFRSTWQTLEIPVRARRTPARVSHGVHVESCELFDQAITVQPCQAVRCP